MRVILLAASLLLLGHGPAPEYPSTTTKKTLYAKTDLRGKAAPKIVVDEWLTGNAPVTRGKVVILDFWATWCPPCRATIPELNALAAEFKDDVVVIGISKEKPEVVQNFMKGTKMAYNVGIDAGDRTGKVVGVEGIPHVLVISPDGIVRWQGFPLDETERLTEATIAQIVAASKAKK